MRGRGLSQNKKGFYLRNEVSKGGGIGYKSFYASPRLPRLLSDSVDVLMFGTNTDLIDISKK